MMRILRVLSRGNLGGPMRQAVSLWHAHAALGHRTLLVTGRCDADEAELPSGLPADAHRVIDTLGRSISARRDRRARRELAELIRTFRPDVVHTHTSKAGWLGRPLARALGVPVVAHTFHGLVLKDYFPRPMSWVVRGIERRLARATDLRFAISASCQRELDGFGIQSEVIAPAVDARAAAASSRQQARMALGLPQDAVVLGFVGRLVAIKRVELFLELLAARPDWRGVVFGDGPARQRVAAAVGPALQWRGADPAAPERLAAFDALVIPSVREGFPLVAVEAAAAGVPVVGFDVPGVHDAVVAAGGGALARPADGVPGLVAAVASVLGAPPPAHAAALVASCAPDRVAARLATRYASVLARRD